MRPIRSLLVSLVLAATIAALALGTASATFPGHANGRIAFGVRLPRWQRQHLLDQPRRVRQAAADDGRRQPPLRRV